MQIRLSSSAQAQHQKMQSLQQANEQLRQKLSKLKKWLSQNNLKQIKQSQNIQNTSIIFQQLKSDNNTKQQTQKQLKLHLQQLQQSQQHNTYILSDMKHAYDRACSQISKLQSKKVSLLQTQNRLRGRLNQKQMIYDESEQTIREYDRQLQISSVGIQSVQSKIASMQKCIKQYQK